MRRGLGRIESASDEAWLKSHLLRSVATALNTPWILDIDTTIKTLFGKQQGAEVGYTRTNRGVPVMRCILTGWPICVCCWMSSSVQANNQILPIRSLASPHCLTRLILVNIRRWSRRKTRWTDDLIFDRHVCRRATPDMEGLQIFCTIRSYLATLHKQGENIIDVLIQAFRGCVTSPRFA